jgi:thioredoxin 1
MKKQTFTDKKLGQYFNANFINVSIDIEKGEGMNLADQYDISSYPTLLFLDENGKLIRKSEGFLAIKQLMELANQYNK